MSFLCGHLISVWEPLLASHIKIIFIFLPNNGKYVSGNTLCNSDDSVTQLILILHFFKINSIIYKPSEEKIQGSHEPTVTGDVFLATVENTDLHHVPAGTVF